MLEIVLRTFLEYINLAANRILLDSNSTIKLYTKELLTEDK